MTGPAGDQHREELVAAGRHLATRGLSPGSSGNLSVRLGDRVLITPTGTGLLNLSPNDIAVTSIEAGQQDTEAPRPSKELPLHRNVYRSRPDASAVVHLHAPFSTALSCLPADVWPGASMPWLTPYQVTKVGDLGVVPYALPGSQELAEGVRRCAERDRCLLLANHGSLAAGSSLKAAVESAEEVEAAAHLLLTLRDLPYQALDAAQVDELRRRL